MAARSDRSDLTRRDALKLAAAAAVAATAGCAGSSPAPPGVAAASSAAPAAQTFFTAAERALADALSEIIIPTDDHSPGAQAAGVAAYIDARLAEAWDESDRTTWRQGLARVEALSQTMHRKAFLAATPDEQVAVVTRMAANEAKPETPEETFFVELKGRVVDAYYSSEIGIKQEMQYLGNTYLTEFEGTDVS